MAEAAPVCGRPGWGCSATEIGASLEDVDALARGRRRSRGPHRGGALPDAGHGFFRDGSADYDDAAAADGWLRLLDWFADRLTTGATETA